MTMCCCVSPRTADSPGSRDSSLDGNGERERFNSGTPFLHRHLPDDYRPAGYKAPPMPSPLTLQTPDGDARTHDGDDNGRPGRGGDTPRSTPGGSSDGDDDDGDSLESSLLSNKSTFSFSDSTRSGATDHRDVVVGTREDRPGEHAVGRSRGDERRKSVDGSGCAATTSSPNSPNPKRPQASRGSPFKTRPGHHRTESAPPLAMGSVGSNGTGGGWDGETLKPDDARGKLLRESLNRPASPGLRAGQGAVSGDVIDGGPRAKAEDPTRRAQGEPYSHRKTASATSLADDDACPICFEEYTSDNPKTPLVCGHHFHLGCVFDWYERSELCPVCEEPLADVGGVLVAATADDD